MVAKIDKLISEGQNLDHNLTREAVDKDIGVQDDPELSKLGQKLFTNHFFALFNCMLAGLTSLMYIPTIVSVLKTTELSSTPMGSFVRYLSTLNHVVEWFKSPSEMMRSLRKIRSIHTKVTQLSIGETGQRMTQFDMVVTQWAFFGPAFIFPERIGLGGATEDELRGLAYKLYQIGYILGVKDEFNLCSGTLSEIRQYCRDVHEKIIKPCMENPSELSIEMAKTMLEGSKKINPFINVDSYTAHVYEMYDINGKEEKVKAISSWHSNAIFSAHLCVVTKLLIWPVVRNFARPIFNFFMSLNITLANKVKGKIITEHYNKFVCKSVARFWSSQTEENKATATTVGKMWMEMVRQKKHERKVQQNVSNFGKTWLAKTREHGKCESSEDNSNEFNPKPENQIWSSNLVRRVISQHQIH